MNETAAFDVLAAGYDVSFSQSLTGQAQRNASRSWLQAFLANRGPLRILEINCGTGDDAWWLASMGHTVTATDQSAAMIEQARMKLIDGGAEANRITGMSMDAHGGLTGNSLIAAPRFITCSFKALSYTLGGEQYDLVFSNFAGLNCIDPTQLSTFGRSVASLLRRDGHLAAVIFGKYCWWETCYFLTKANLRQAFRRWTHKPKLARLNDDVHQEIHYYSVRRFLRELPAFKLKARRPVGLFIPPSYMEPAMRRHHQVFTLLSKLEKQLQQFSVCSSLADHTYLLLKKELL